MKLKVILGIALVGAALVVGACGGSKTTTPPAKTTPPATPPAAAAITLTVTENPYAFGTKEIRVKAGSNSIKITGGKELHTFTVADLKIDQAVAAGASVTVTIPTDKKGTFKLICTPHESLGMVGTVVVE